MSRNNESSWVFDCRFGFTQDTCDEYQADPEARGFDRFQGCASCAHRIATNDTTEDAENAWARHLALKEADL